MKNLFPAITMAAAVAVVVIPEAGARPGEGMDEAMWTEGRRMNPELPRPGGKLQKSLVVSEIFNSPLTEMDIELGRPHVFPIVVSLRDKEDRPVKGAIVMLKRMGPDGWTEEELLREAKDAPRTDENGTLVIHYPGTPKADPDGPPVVEIHGAVTVIAEGQKPRMVELKDFFRDGKHAVSNDSAPKVRISVGE